MATPGKYKIGQKPKRPRKPRVAKENKRPVGRSRREVKLKLTKIQEQQLTEWFLYLRAVYNWGIRRIELDAGNRIYHSRFDFIDLLNGTSERLGIPSKVIQQTLDRAYTAWERCFTGVSKKPRFKSKRNPLSSILFPDNCQIPEPGILRILGFKGGRKSGPVLRYKQQHAQKKYDIDRRCMIDQIPKDLLGSVVLKKKASGWYASILVRREPNAIARAGFGQIGIDPGFKTLITTSNGDKIEHPREFYAKQERLAQAQRGKNKKLSARISERIARSVRDRNHKLSRKLVSENSFITYSKDNLIGMSRSGFGKSVLAASGGQLREMVRSKSSKSGTEYREVDSRKSTKTCCICSALSGPTGKAGLKVREWTCTGCGTHHDRDTNSAVNTFIAGAGQAHEWVVAIRRRYLSEICPQVVLTSTNT